MENERSQCAMKLFGEGFNCAQSVVAAWADRYGIDRDTALRMSSSFGGGIGRMRLTCGAACGLFMLAGLETGSTDAADRQAKSKNYKIVQELAEEFKKKMGSITCAELLGLKKADMSFEASERTPEYYRKRPCKDIVGHASDIFANFLENRAGEKADE